MSRSTEEEFHKLSFYTLAHTDTMYFIHQHIVDAYQAEIADSDSRPIGVIFSLVGLYLYLDKNYTGRQVQKAHIRLAKVKNDWPIINLPTNRGGITITDVLKASSGEDRDTMINKWCVAVWSAYEDSHKIIENLVKERLNLS